MGLNSLDELPELAPYLPEGVDDEDETVAEEPPPAEAPTQDVVE